jgi:hypothetical protein
MPTSRISIRISTLIATLAMAVAGLDMAPAAPPPAGSLAKDTAWGPMGWVLSEFQPPDIPHGGRANTIAVKPEHAATAVK